MGRAEMGGQSAVARPRPAGSLAPDLQGASRGELPGGWCPPISQASAGRFYQGWLREKERGLDCRSRRFAVQLVA